MIQKWTDSFFAKIQLLIGDRGQHRDHAVRFRDLEGITVSTLRIAGQQSSDAIAPIEGDVADLINDVAQAEAALLANEAAIGDTKSKVRNLFDRVTTTAIESIDDIATSHVTRRETAGTIQGLSVSLQGANDNISAQATALSGLAVEVTEIDGNVTALAAEQTTLSSTILAVDQATQGFSKTVDSLDDGNIGAAITATLGPAGPGAITTVVVAEGATARSTSGITNGYAIEIPAQRAVLFGGNRIRISVLAFAPASGAASRFGIAYSTNGSGDSGYLAAGDLLTTTPQWFTFYYQAPMLGPNVPHYLSIFGDHDKAGGETIISRILVQVAATAGDLPEISELTATVDAILATDVSSLTGTALATLLNQLDVSAGGVSATIIEQAAALATIDGNAAATYTLRLGAGGALAGFEIVAADDPISGPTSTIKFTAGNVLFPGTVTAALMNIVELSAITANLGTFVSGDPLGERMVITGDVIEIYDAANTLRVKIGDLS